MLAATLQSISGAAPNISSLLLVCQDPSNAVVHQMQRNTVAQALKIDRSRTAGSELERGNDDDEVCPLECVSGHKSVVELCFLSLAY